MAGSTAAHVKRNTIGGVIGNVLEWYDFAVLGFFATDSMAALINAFGVFAAGYLMRPLGGILFGHIVLAGAATNWCIRATAYGALDRGYDLTLIEDARTTADMESESGATILAEGIIQELNIVMAWLSYPDRKCATATAAKVEFSGLRHGR